MLELQLFSINKREALALNKQVFDLDIDIVNGCALQVSADAAELLRASIACYTKKGTIPSQEDKGIHWESFLSGLTPYNEIIFSLTKRLENLIGPGKYLPSFQQDGTTFKFHLLNIKRG
jgi:hypothetical protein